MLTYRFPDHLGVCEVDGHTLMLDLRRDRYFLLDEVTALSVRRWRQKPDGPLEEAALSRLLERGMLVPGEPGRPPITPTVPHRALLDAPAPRSAWRLAPEIAATLWRVRRRLKRFGLERAVAEVRRSKPSITQPDPRPHLALFRAARRLVPSTPNCLIDSLALSAFLSRRNIGSALVFGVKLDPFAAHCWLQNGDAILNDAPDSVAPFTPIMVV